MEGTVVIALGIAILLIALAMTGMEALRKDEKEQDPIEKVEDITQ